MLPSLDVGRDDCVVVVGVGSDQRGDDGAGDQVARRLDGVASDRLHAVRAGVAPENYTGVVKGFDPDVVVLVDAVAFGGAVGDVRRIDPENLRHGAISTHNAPLSLLVEYLERETGAAVVVLGVQPGDVSPGETLSAPVARSVRRLVEWLTDELAA